MAASAPDQIHLSREGKVIGPFSTEEIEELRRTKGIFEYAWIWTPESLRWTAIHSEPPPLIEAKSDSAAKPQLDSFFPGTEPAVFDLDPLSSLQPLVELQTQEEKQPEIPVKPNPVLPVQAPAPVMAPLPVVLSQPPAASTPKRFAEAICYDRHSLVGGMVEATDQNGASVSCTADLRELSVFRIGQNVFVNLIDEASGKSENLRATVAEIERTDRGFRYTFRWKSNPASPPSFN